ncbi:hypothetical protein V866_000379 [Kwoniella sp. B9012]
MPSFRQLTQAASLATIAVRATNSSSSLDELCTTANVQAALPPNGTFLGIEIYPDSVTAAVTTVSSAGSGGGMMAKRDGPTNSTSSATSSSSTSTSTSSSSTSYCNVTLSYTHAGSSDTVNLVYAFPAPDDYKSRFYVGGGGGYSLNSDATGGLDYGAASGVTDGGYDAFNYSYDEKALLANGTVNWQAAHMFGYQALGEMTKIGKYITPNFYGVDNSTKVYTYYSGCSDGGREGMSQVQRYGSEYDGVIAGAPAFRFAQQQVLHVYPAAVEQVQNYFPAPCAIAKIVNATIEACDSLDGRSDGVVSRTDLCQLNFNLSSVIGQSYYCAAESSSSLGFGFSKRAQGSSSSTTPEQNGTITAEDVAVAQAVYDGLFNSAGEQAYLSWQITADISDADTTYNNETEAWELSIPSTGGLYVRKFVELLDLDNLDNLDGVTYDTLVEWMQTGFERFYDTLQTTYPDLTEFQSNGGKLIHYHGESDPSIPAGSSVHYWQSVREWMYPGVDTTVAEEQMKEWYQFYLVPGAAHCGANSLQPGPYPSGSSLMSQIINWIENGEAPAGLNATVSSGDYSGETQELCMFPTRPLWSSNSTFDCVTDDEGNATWDHSFTAFKQAVY